MFNVCICNLKMFNIATQTLNKKIMTAIEFNTNIMNQRDSFRHFAYSLTANYDDANDLVQETLVRALKNRDKFDPSTNIKAWLFTIMKNTFINQYRRQRKSKKLFDSFENNKQIGRITDVVFVSPESKMNADEIMKAIDDLNDEFKVPFMMHFEGYKYQEIAEELNLSIGTVKSRIFFCRKKLMAKLQHLEN